jgi:small subunit ribosomal protein S24e
MTAKVESHKKNPLLRREEAWIVIEHEGKPTPKRADIIEEAAKAMKADKELVIVDKIFSKEGRAASNARVYVYSKKEDMPAAKVEKMKRRMGIAKPETPEGAPAPGTG